MNCKQARDELALGIDQATESDAPLGLGVELQTHLARCEACRQSWSELQESHGCLKHLQMTASHSDQTGLWPDIKAQISDRGLRPDRRPFNGWIVGVGFVALFAALLFHISQPAPEDQKTELVEPLPELEPADLRVLGLGAHVWDRSDASDLAVKRAWPRSRDFPETMRLLPGQRRPVDPGQPDAARLYRTSREASDF